MTPLRQRMIEDMQVRNLSAVTQRVYALYARHFGKSPTVLGPEEIRQYQLYLTKEKKLSASSILVAGAAIRFLYKVTLKKEWRIEEVVPTCKKPQKLPVVLSPEEVARFLGCIDSNKHRVILTICYATGLKISEAVRLKAASIDSQRMVIRVEQGKGRKDRYVMLSPKLLEVLRGYWRGTAKGMAVPRRYPRSAYRQSCCRTCLQEGASTLRCRQACHSSFPAPRLRRSSP